MIRKLILIPVGYLSQTCRRALFTDREPSSDRVHSFQLFRRLELFFDITIGAVMTLSGLQIWFTNLVYKSGLQVWFLSLIFESGLQVWFLSLVFESGFIGQFDEW